VTRRERTRAPLGPRQTHRCELLRLRVRRPLCACALPPSECRASHRLLLAALSRNQRRHRRRNAPQLSIGMGPPPEESHSLPAARRPPPVSCLCSTQTETLASTFGAAAEPEVGLVSPVSAACVRLAASGPFPCCCCCWRGTRAATAGREGAGNEERGEKIEFQIGIEIRNSKRNVECLLD